MLMLILVIRFLRLRLMPSEFLAPSACIQDELPTVMNGQGWMKLKELKEYWGISMQALFV